MSILSKKSERGHLSRLKNNRGAVSTLALIEPTTIADFIQLGELEGGKCQVNVIVQQNVITNQAEPYYPAFLRLPKNGERCPVSGLYASTLSSLIREPDPKVESISLKVDGASRGCRLIVTESLLRYLNSHRESGPDSTRYAKAIPMSLKPLNIPIS